MATVCDEGSAGGQMRTHTCTHTLASAYKNTHIVSFKTSIPSTNRIFQFKFSFINEVEMLGEMKSSQAL